MIVTKKVWITLGCTSVAVIATVWTVMVLTRSHEQPVPARERPPVATAAAPASKPVPVPGVDVPFEVKQAYVDKASKKLISPNDCDGDALPDDWEMKRYGTLKYDAKTYSNAPRIDVAKRSVDPKDTDGDGLDDAWEMRHFGNLSQGPHDDPDQDGFDNITECYMKTNPAKPDLVDPSRRPKVLVSAKGRSPESVSTMETVEFWQKQDKLRAARAAAPTTAPTTHPVAARLGGR